nr:alpha-N-acetylgalactosaminide alpha-2,6-sialyltransferase 5 isoform X1 [Paramormyrops kingsleyae]
MTTQICWGTVFRKRGLLFPAADPGAKRELSKTPQRFCLPAPQPARRRGIARLHPALRSRRSDAAAVERCGAVRLARQPAVRDAVRRCLCQPPDCSDQAHFGLQPPKMKTPMRHGVAAFLLITMCTSLLFVYNISTSKEHNDAGSRHRQKPTVPYSRSPRAPRTPALQGYGSIIDHRPLNMHCRTCALVTSSGQLIGGGRGREIDSAECVIRMNDAPTQDYQRDVGDRTSLRVVAHSSMQRVLHGRRELLNGSRDTVFIFWGPSAYMRRDGKGLVYNNLRLVKQVLPELRVYIISRQKMLQFDELFKRETGKDRCIDPHVARRDTGRWLCDGLGAVTLPRHEGAFPGCIHLSNTGQ